MRRVMPSATEIVERMVKGDAAERDTRDMPATIPVTVSSVSGGGRVAFVRDDETQAPPVTAKPFPMLIPLMSAPAPGDRLVYVDVEGLGEGYVVKLGTTADLPGVMSTTSSTSNTISASGTKTWVTTQKLAVAVGGRVRVASTLTPTNFMEGQVLTNNGTSISVSVDLSSGSGNFIAWTINVAGQQGAQGPQGTAGTAGASGRGITNVTIDGSGHLIITYSDSTTTDAGYVIGPQGAAGAAGANGSDAPRHFFGSTNPATNPPAGSYIAGDTYFRTDGSKSIFVYDGSVWNNAGF